MLCIGPNDRADGEEVLVEGEEPSSEFPAT